LRLEFFSATLADVEKLAGIERHLLGGLEAASGARQGRLQLHGVTSSEMP
jgi:hypothetical protein